MIDELDLAFDEHAERGRPRHRRGGRGGGNADLAQGGGVPADQVPVLLGAVEKAVAGLAG